MAEALAHYEGHEAWMAQSDGETSDAGLISSVFRVIHQALGLMVKADASRERKVSIRLRNDYERLYLWADGLSVERGHLDANLANSEELRLRLLALLHTLGSDISEVLPQLDKLSSPFAKDTHDTLRRLLDATRFSLTETEYSGPETDSSSDTDSDASELSDIVASISTHVDCMLDMAAVLEDPALDSDADVITEAPRKDIETFTVTSQEALIYCRRIRDRFEGAPKYLVERLAEANVSRAANLRNHNKRSMFGIGKDHDRTESIFTKSMPSSSDFTKSSLDPSSIFSQAVDISDSRSETTFATFSTTASAVSLGRPRPPPMPEVNDLGDLDCSICHMRIRALWNKKTWRQHVFDDLRPYVCTFEHCDSSNELYHRTTIWAQHNSIHLDTSQQDELKCPLCLSIYQNHATVSFIKHVSNHMREISLYVLPQPLLEEEELPTDLDDTDGSEDGRLSAEPTSDREGPPGEKPSGDTQDSIGSSEEKPGSSSGYDRSRNVLSGVDPDCALCNAPAKFNCNCESRAFAEAVKNAELRIMGPQYGGLRDWCRRHAEDLVHKDFDELRRKRVAAIQPQSIQLSDQPDITGQETDEAEPLQDANGARDELKSGINDDWKSSVQRYPEVLDYFFSLVQGRVPSDSDPEVRDPPLSAIFKRGVVRTRQPQQKAGSSSVEAGLAELAQARKV